MDINKQLHTVDVAVEREPYNVFIGQDLVNRLNALIPKPKDAHKGVLVTSQAIYDLYGERVEHSLEEAGLIVEVMIVPDGETAKSLETLESLYTFFGEIILGRRDIVIALGGGVVGDLAGFAAATWARGVYLVQIATTVVAQVDSAIGGKTGVNMPSGKNLVGAFHQPLAVINDISTLETLPERQFRAGLAEIVKYGFIADPAILNLLEGKSLAELQGDSSLMTDLIVRSVRVKAKVVAGDELEAGGREVLNYGHTLGHALETLAQYRGYLHGEAVAVGMVFAAMLGVEVGVSDPGLVDQTIAILSQLGLPTAASEHFSIDEIWPLMRLDKKAVGGVRFVLVPQLGEALLLMPDERTVMNLLRSFGS